APFPGLACGFCAAATKVGDGGTDDRFVSSVNADGRGILVIGSTTAGRGTGATLVFTQPAPEQGAGATSIRPTAVTDAAIAAQVQRDRCARYPFWRSRKRERACAVL